MMEPRTVFEWGIALLVLSAGLFLLGFVLSFLWELVQDHRGE